MNTKGSIKEEMDKETPACLCPHVQLGCQHSSKPTRLTPRSRAASRRKSSRPPPGWGAVQHILAKGPLSWEAGEPVPTSYASWVAWASDCHHPGPLLPPCKRHDKISLAWLLSSSPSPAARKTAFTHTGGKCPIQGFTQQNTMEHPPCARHCTATECQMLVHRFVRTTSYNHHPILRGVCPYSHFPQEKIKLGKDKSLFQSHAASR